MRILGFALMVAAMLCWPCALLAQQEGARSLSPAQLFAFADAARDRDDFTVAESAYRALSMHGDTKLRHEARFRLGMMLADKEHHYREAAVEFRIILDENPQATRVRLELARMNALLGETSAAQRQLRAAAAGGLPSDVAQTVRFYTNSLAARQRLGGGIEVAVAPDSNVNRATRASSLDTVIGNFTLNPDAKANSGVGLALRGQGFSRLSLSKHVNLFAQLSGQASLYRDRAFNDVIVSPRLGPEIYAGKDKIQILAGPAWRWYGGSIYSRSLTASANWQHSMSARSQLRVTGDFAHIDNRRNALEDGDSYALTLGIDHAITARLGGGISLSGVRQTANDPGFATVAGGISGFLYRDTGRTTIIAGLGYSNLGADARFSLFPERRTDERFTANIGGTFRMLRLGSWAPVARLSYEQNRSTLTLYDYSRVAAEFGISAAF